MPTFIELCGAAQSIAAVVAAATILSKQLPAKKTPEPGEATKIVKQVNGFQKGATTQRTRTFANIIMC